MQNISATAKIIIITLLTIVGGVVLGIYLEKKLARLKVEGGTLNLGIFNIDFKVKKDEKVSEIIIVEGSNSN